MREIIRKKKLSVIVPIYNTRNYLNECLDSIRKQTFKELEIMCIDGGSTDGSLEIISEYIEKDTRFKLITDTKGSYGAQVNRGFELASGEYVAIAEPDDYVSETMYELLYNEAVNTNSDIVKSDYCRFIGDRKDRFFFPKSICRKEWYGKDLIANVEKDLFESTPANWAGIYKKSFIDKNGIRHNTTKGAAYQDLGFWFLATSMAHKIRFIPHTGYYYRIDNPNSSINSINKAECLKNELTWLKNQLENRGLYDEYKEKYSRIEYIHNGWMRRKTDGIKYTECYKMLALDDNKAFILFGCGADGVEYLLAVQREKLLGKIKYLTDNDKNLWGKHLLDIPVLSPEEAVKKAIEMDRNKTFFIIGSTRYVEEIQSQLEELGISDNSILFIGA